MKNNLPGKAALSLACIVLWSAATAQQKMVKLDCYTGYKNQGDAYNNSKDYDLALQQYQKAKYCNYLSDGQRRILDSLIADVGRKRQAVIKKVIVRKY